MSNVLSEPLLGELVHRFQNEFGDTRGLHVAWAPGRINLIGEHIDYNHLPVLPMAIQRGTYLVFKPRDDARVRITSSNSRFEPRSFDVAEIVQPYESGDWGNYVKAAAQTVAARYSVVTGFDGIVHSTLPVASGLSSSSALVVAAALAFLTGECDECGPFDLMVALADGERYVGVQGGGMDQAVILGAREGAATHVSFAPLQIELVSIPSTWQFIVAHSLEDAPKSEGAMQVYNERTEESYRAVRAMVEAFGLDATVSEYQALIDEVGPECLLREAERRLDATQLRRLRHVVTETDRVFAAVGMLSREDLSGFGPLLCDSHRSLRDDYDVSTAELDELAETAVAAGAVGARLTGAGLGGCVIALCDAANAPQVVEGLTAHFYDRREFDADIEDVLFTVAPSDGARVLSL